MAPQLVKNRDYNYGVSRFVNQIWFNNVLEIRKQGKEQSPYITNIIFLRIKIRKFRIIRDKERRKKERKEDIPGL